jgi:hypothetical protein
MGKLLVALIIGFSVFGISNVIKEKEIKLNNNNLEINKNIVVNPTTTVMNKIIIHNVPFIAQAPLGNWDDLRQEDGCEEASILMAMMWAKKFPLKTKDVAEQEIIKISEFEKEKYGSYIDTSVEDTIDRILIAYFNYDKYKKIQNFDKEMLKNYIYENKLIVIPVNGQKLNNPNFTMPGPIKHMLIIIGYDPETKEFITNDPGTKNGEKYRYNEDHLFSVIYNYQSSDKNDQLNEKTAILIDK